MSFDFFFFFLFSLFSLGKKIKRQGSFRRKIYTFAEKKWCWDKIQEQREQKHSTHNVLRYV